MNDAEILRLLIDRAGVKQIDVARGAGIAESTVSSVLSGRRELTRSQIAKLSAYFNVKPQSFF